MTYVYDRSKTFFFIIVLCTVLFSSRKLAFLINLEVSTCNGMGGILKFELLESYDMLIFSCKLYKGELKCLKNVFSLDIQNNIFILMNGRFYIRVVNKLRFFEVVKKDLPVSCI